MTKGTEPRNRLGDDVFMGGNQVPQRAVKGLALRHHHIPGKQNLLLQRSDHDPGERHAICGERFNDADCDTGLNDVKGGYR